MAPPSGSSRSSSKENGVGAVAPSSSRPLTTKKKSYNGLGLCETEPKKRRVVLRDVSQEYEVEGDEPVGFRDVPVKPTSTKLKIFVDDVPAPSSKAPPSAPPSQPKKKPGLQIYTSPTLPTTALPPKRRAPLGGGLGGGAKGLRT